MTWWAWTLLVWVLVSVPTALLVGCMVRGSDRAPQQRCPRPTTSENVEGLGDVATSRVIRGRLIRG